MRLRYHARVAVPTLIILPAVLMLTGGLFFGNSSKAAMDDESIYYFLTDHLGSVDVVLDDQGNVVERRDFLPYGAARLTETAPDSPGTDYGFTGKALDDETGLSYYGARYYDAEIGRFISMDPREGDLKNPQTLNRYSYVLNNPVKYVDPTGMYQTDVHFDLTYYLGLTAGLNGEQAAKVAKYNEAMDHDISTRPENPLATNECHFASRAEARGKLTTSIEAGSLEDFGQALHSFQDSYSHFGLTPTEHIKQGEAPDVTALDPEKADRMARVSYLHLRRLNMAINGIGELTEDEYALQTTEIWDRFKDEIGTQNRLTRDKANDEKIGTKIEKLARIAEKDDN